MNEGTRYSLCIVGTSLWLYFLIGLLLDNFSYTGFYNLRLFLFITFLSIIALIYYVNLKLRETTYGEELSFFWRRIEQYIPFAICWPLIIFAKSFLVIALTYDPALPPFNYYLNFCIGILPFFFLIFLNDLSAYQDYLDALWRFQPSE